MEKRYQVFVSSTFNDLFEERNQVSQTIMKCGCFPAGMELFPAIDDSQFEFIKQIVDESDYYILIIGGRYGSVSEDGISYTEKEFDYAIEKKIPVLVFLHANPEEIPLGKSERGDIQIAKLNNFRIKAASGRLVKFFKNADSLAKEVATSLPLTIKLHPGRGWIRAEPEALSAGSQLSLKRTIDDYLQEDFPIFYRDISMNQDDNFINLPDQVFVTTLKSFLLFVGPTLLGLVSETSIQTFFDVFIAKKMNLEEVEVRTSSVAHAKAKLSALKIIYTEIANHVYFWGLTNLGKEKMDEFLLD
jgi:hypothetical protein